MKSATPLARILRITLTAERHEDHFQVRLHGKPVELTFTTLRALLRLLLARSKPGAGFTAVSHVTIARLRRALDNAQRGAGKALIQTGCREEYRLSIPRSHLRAALAVTPCFSELVDLKVLSKDEAAVLRQIARRVNSS